MIDPAVLLDDMLTDPADLGLSPLIAARDWVALVRAYATPDYRHGHAGYGATPTRLFAVLLDAQEEELLSDRHYQWFQQLYQAGSVDLSNPLVVNAIRTRLIGADSDNPVCPITLGHFDYFLMAGRPISRAEALFGEGVTVEAGDIVAALNRRVIPAVVPEPEPVPDPIPDPEPVPDPEPEPEPDEGKDGGDVGAEAEVGAESVGRGDRWVRG